MKNMSELIEAASELARQAEEYAAESRKFMRDNSTHDWAMQCISDCYDLVGYCRKWVHRFDPEVNGKNGKDGVRCLEREDFLGEKCFAVLETPGGRKIPYGVLFREPPTRHALAMGLKRVRKNGIRGPVVFENRNA